MAEQQLGQVINPLGGLVEGIQGGIQLGQQYQQMALQRQQLEEQKAIRQAQIDNYYDDNESQYMAKAFDTKVSPQARKLFINKWKEIRAKRGLPIPEDVFMAIEKDPNVLQQVDAALAREKLSLGDETGRRAAFRLFNEISGKEGAPLDLPGFYEWLKNIGSGAEKVYVSTEGAKAKAAAGVVGKAVSEGGMDASQAFAPGSLSNPEVLKLAGQLNTKNFQTNEARKDQRLAQAEKRLGLAEDAKYMKIKKDVFDNKDLQPLRKVTQNMISDNKLLSDPKGVSWKVLAETNANLAGAITGRTAWSQAFLKMIDFDSLQKKASEVRSYVSSNPDQKAPKEVVDFYKNIVVRLYDFSSKYHDTQLANNIIAVKKANLLPESQADVLWELRQRPNSVLGDESRQAGAFINPAEFNKPAGGVQSAPQKQPAAPITKYTSMDAATKGAAKANMSVPQYIEFLGTQGIGVK